MNTRRACAGPRVRIGAPALLALLIGLVAGDTRGWAQAAQREPGAIVEVIAGYLAGFARNLSWPADPAREVIRIGVVAEAPVVARFERELANVTVNGRRLLASEVHRTAEAAQCQIVLLHNPKQRRLDEFLEATVGKPVLTVVYSEDRGARGGIIELIAVKSSLRYTVNARELRRTGLQASPELLEFALRAPPR